MVSASTRRLPWTMIVVADCAYSRTEDARPVQPRMPNRYPPRTKQTASPRKTRTPTSIRHAPFRSHGRPRTESTLDGQALPLVQRFRGMQTNYPSPSFPFPSNRCRSATIHEVARCRDVIESCKDHQHDDDRQADPKTNFLGALRQGLAARRLDSVEQKVTAIEQRDREQVEQADRDREAPRRGGSARRSRPWPPDRKPGRSGWVPRADRRLPGRQRRRRYRTACGRPRTRSPAHPCSTACSGSTFCVLMSPGVIDRLMPSTPSRCTLPKLSLSSLSSGVALQRDRHAAALDLDRERSRRACADDPLHVRESCRSGSPLMASTRSPGWNPAAAAALPGCTRIHPRGGGLLAENRENAGENRDRQNEIRDRPGRDHGRARADRLVDKADRLFFLASCRRAAAMIGHAGRIFIAEEFHVAAQRNRRDLPAGAVAVVETARFRARIRWKTQHSDAAPARHQKMAKLMEKHDDRQHKQKGDDDSRKTPPNASDAPECRKLITTLVPAPYGVPIVTGCLLGCLCGNFGQEVSGYTISQYGQRRAPPRFRPAPPEVPAPAAASSVASTSARNARKTDATGDKLAYRDLIGGIEHGRRRPARLERAARQRQSRKPGQIGGLKVSSRICARSSRGAGPSIRRGHARQWAIGIRMSGDTQLRHHRAVAEFDQPVHDRLRVNEHVHLLRLAARTDDAPRSIRGPCSSGSPSRR